MIDLLITDDHPIVRQGIMQILSECMDIGEMEEASNGNELLSKLRKKDYSMVLLDISMPGRDGLEVLKDVKKLKPDMPVLMLSMHPEEQYAIRALRSGASGYLTKESVTDELIKAILKVAAGGKYISQELAENLASELVDPGDKPLHFSLSDRELGVMKLMAGGNSVGDIAEELSLSPKTISTYRVRILEKLQLNNTAEIIRYALKNELVD